jgi:hypothetical protein
MNLKTSNWTKFLELLWLLAKHNEEIDNVVLENTYCNARKFNLLK